MIRRTTWVVLIVFAVLLAATLFWQRSKLSQPEEEPVATPSVQFMLDLDEASISGLSIVDAEGKSVELERDEEGNWTLIKPAGEDANSPAVDSALTQLISARVVSQPSSINSLEVVGLDSPSYVIVLHLDNGSQFLVNVGNPTPTGNGYYVLTSDRIIYIVNRSNLDTIIAFLESPPIQPTPTPTVEPTPEGTTSPEESALTPEAEDLTRTPEANPTP